MDLRNWIEQHGGWKSELKLADLPLSKLQQIVEERKRNSQQLLPLDETLADVQPYLPFISLPTSRYEYLEGATRQVVRWPDFAYAMLQERKKTNTTEHLFELVKTFLLSHSDLVEETDITAGKKRISYAVDSKNTLNLHWKNKYMGCLPALRIFSIEPEDQPTNLCSMETGTYTWVMFLSPRSKPKPKMYLALVPNYWHPNASELFGRHLVITTGVHQRFPGSLAFLSGEAFLTKDQGLTFNLLSGSLMLPLVRHAQEVITSMSSSLSGTLEESQQLFWIPLAKFLWSILTSACNLKQVFDTSTKSLLKNEPVTLEKLRDWFCQPPLCTDRLRQDLQWDKFLKKIILNGKPFCDSKSK